MVYFIAAFYFVRLGRLMRDGKKVYTRKDIIEYAEQTLVDKYGKIN